MVLTICSGGQTGVDRAALDAALELNFPVSGWCPKGNRSEDGVIPAHYKLSQTPSSSYPQRTKWNIRDTDGTLILAWGKLTGGTKLTKTFAENAEKPFLIIDLTNPPAPNLTLRWIQTHHFKRLNVAGPRASHGTYVYSGAFNYLKNLLHLVMNSPDL